MGTCQAPLVWLLSDGSLNILALSRTSHADRSLRRTNGVCLPPFCLAQAQAPARCFSRPPQPLQPLRHPWPRRDACWWPPTSVWRRRQQPWIAVHLEVSGCPLPRAGTFRNLLQLGLELAGPWVGTRIAGAQASENGHSRGNQVPAIKTPLLIPAAPGSILFARNA